MDSDGEKSTICLSDLLLSDSYSMHTVPATGPSWPHSFGHDMMLTHVVVVQIHKV